MALRWAWAGGGQPLQGRKFEYAGIGTLRAAAGSPYMESQCILIENLAWVQDAFGVKYLLNAAHEVDVGLG